MSKVIRPGMGIFHFFILLVCYLDMNITSPIFPNFLFKNSDLGGNSLYGTCRILAENKKVKIPREV